VSAARKPFDLAAAAADYAAGLSPVEIGAKQAVSKWTVRNRLAEAGVALRPGHRPRVDLDPEAVAAEYRAGASIAEIAARRGTSRQTVHNRLVEAGVARRPRGRRRVDLDPEAVAAEYRAGATIAEIAARHGLSRDSVHERLIAAGVRPRPACPRRGRWRVRVDVEAMAADYRAGATIAEVAERHGLSYATAHRRLHAAGVAIRPGGAQPGRPGGRGPARVDVAAAAADYRAGASIAAIADRQGVSYWAVRRRLRAAGVALRPPGRVVGPAARAVLAALVRLGEASPAALAAETGYPAARVGGELRKLRWRGLATRRWRGRWRPTARAVADEGPADPFAGVRFDDHEIADPDRDRYAGPPRPRLPAPTWVPGEARS